MSSVSKHMKFFVKVAHLYLCISVTLLPHRHYVDHFVNFADTIEASFMVGRMSDTVIPAMRVRVMIRLVQVLLRTMYSFNNAINDARAVHREWYQGSFAMNRRICTTLKNAGARRYRMSCGTLNVRGLTLPVHLVSRDSLCKKSLIQKHCSQVRGRAMSSVSKHKKQFGGSTYLFSSPPTKVLYITQYYCMPPPPWATV